MSIDEINKKIDSLERKLAVSIAEHKQAMKKLKSLGFQNVLEIKEEIKKIEAKTKRMEKRYNELFQELENELSRHIDSDD